MSVTDYGAFVEIEPGVEGLIHVSEMTWSRRMKHPGKVVKAGDQVEAVVLEVKPRERRVSLGIKQFEADPWTTVGERYSIGSVVEGRVRKLADFGAFIEIEEGVDGLVHVSDLSWTKHVKHPSEVLKKGQLMQAVILASMRPTAVCRLGSSSCSRTPGRASSAPHEVGRHRARPGVPRRGLRSLRGTGAWRGGSMPQIGDPAHAGPDRCRDRRCRSATNTISKSLK